MTDMTLNIKDDKIQIQFEDSKGNRFEILSTPFQCRTTALSLLNAAQKADGMKMYVINGEIYFKP